MGDFDRKVLRRQWLNQVLSWCIRGSVKGVAYTREQVLRHIEEDLQQEDAVVIVPEAPVIFQMFKTGKTTKVIEEYTRQILRNGKDEKGERK